MTFKILIQTDFSPGVGFGHFSRCCALAAQFVKLGHHVRLEEVTRLSLPEHSFNSDFLKPDGIIIDSHKSIHTLMEKYRIEGIFHATLDNFDKFGGDLNFYVFEHPGMALPKKRISGVSNIIINDSLFNLIPREGDYILVCIGGADIQRKGEAISNALLNKGYKVVLINGPLAPKQTTLNHPRFSFLHRPANFLELLANAGGVVVNGGNTLFESLYLKKKAYVFPQSKMEENLARFFLEKKNILGVVQSIENQEFVFSNLPAESSEIDGKGSVRIVETFLEELNSRKNVS